MPRFSHAVEQVVSIWPHHRFILRCHGSRSEVMARVRGLIIENMGFVESFHASRDALRGRVEDASFEARPMRSWMGNFRARPRIAGVVREDAAGTFVEVSVHTGCVGSFVILAAVVALMTMWPLGMRVVIGVVGSVLVIVSHIAEGNRAQRLLQPIAWPSDVE